MIFFVVVVLEFLQGLFVPWGTLLVVYAYYGCEGWFYVLVVFLAILVLGCIAYGEQWDGCNCVDVDMLVEW